jgi:hypothetical protein
MDWQTVIDVLTAVCAAYAAMGVYRLQRGQDHLAGKVQAIEATQNAHVNAPGLHSR